MSPNAVVTTVSAQVALQSLSATSSQRQTTRKRISPGDRGSAAAGDDAFAVPQRVRANSSARQPAAAAPVAEGDDSTVQTSAADHQPSPDANPGSGALVDADLSKESANLQALQIRQQLGTQALPLANQSPQALLSLFK